MVVIELHALPTLKENKRVPAERGVRASMLGYGDRGYTGGGGSGWGCIGEGGFDGGERKWCLGCTVVWVFAKKEDLKRGAMDEKKKIRLKNTTFREKQGGVLQLIENVFRLTRFSKCNQTLENTKNVLHRNK